jgi:hypothetical protein
MQSITKRQNRILILIALLFVILIKSDAGTSTTNLSSKRYAEPFKDQLNNFVFLISERTIFNESLPESTASGFIFASTRSHIFIMTANHFCWNNDIAEQLEFAKRTIIAVNKEYPREAHILLTDEKNDICVLSAIKFKWEKFKTIKFAKSMPKTGEKVYNFAAPNGISSPNTNLMFEGYFSGCEDLCLYTIPATFGSSGSAVYNSKGELISILVAATPDFENVGLGPDIYTIRKFINEANNTVRIK